MSRPSVPLLIAWLLAVSATGAVRCSSAKSWAWLLAYCAGISALPCSRWPCFWEWPFTATTAGALSMPCLWRWRVRSWLVTTASSAAGLVPKAWVPCGAGVSCADQKLDILYGIELPWLSLAAFTAIAVSLSLICEIEQ